ncbi:MAG: hypothetical protein OXC91_11710, partial [Rhodobacteraceae bacterium]|nr:hypothetical protein [Paracoccaceae bacterium]
PSPHSGSISSKRAGCPAVTGRRVMGRFSGRDVWVGQSGVITQIPCETDPGPQSGSGKTAIQDKFTLAALSDTIGESAARMVCIARIARDIVTAL